MMKNANKHKTEQINIILDLNVDDDRFRFSTTIDDALAQAQE